MSAQHHSQQSDSEQNTFLLQNIIEPNSNGREKIIFQPEEDETIIPENTKQNQENYSPRAVEILESDKCSHYPVSKQNIVLHQNTETQLHPSQSLGREIIFQSEEKTVILDTETTNPQHEAIEQNPNPVGERIVRVEDKKATSENTQPTVRQDSVVQSTDENTDNALLEETKLTKHQPNLPAVRDSAIVKYHANLPTISEDEFIPPINRWTKFGGLFIVAVVALAIPISAMTKYKETIKTQATIRPNGESRLVQAATEGRVTQISVKNNQAVNKGDPIATIDDSRLQTQKSQLEDSVQKLRSQFAQINAQIDALNNQISAESDRIQSSVAAAESELERVRREYQDKQVITQAEVRRSQSDLNAATSALNAAQAKLNRYQDVAQKGAISQDQLQEVEQQLLQQQQAVEAAQAKLTSDRTTLNPSDAEVMSATSRIAEARATGTASLAVLNKEKQALIQRRIEIGQQIERDSKELQQTETDIEQTTITATSDGIVSQLNLRNRGQILRPGEQIARIAPTNSEIVIKTAVPAKSIGKLELGQTAQMRVSACPYSDYGTLKGTVTAIAPDAIVPQPDNVDASTSDIASRNGNASFYDVVIEPTETILGKEDNKCVIQLGMEGQADIVTKEETVLQFLLRKARLTTSL